MAYASEYGGSYTPLEQLCPPPHKLMLSSAIEKEQAAEATDNQDA